MSLWGLERSLQSKESIIILNIHSMQHNAYIVYIIMLYVGLIQKYHNTFDLWLTKQSSQENWKQCFKLQSFEVKTKSITVFLNRAYWIFWKITLLNLWKQHHYRDIGSVRKNSIIGVIYNWYVSVYLNIVLKVCKMATLAILITIR